MRHGLIEIQMPAMGESVTEGTILEWHVSEGQEIAEGDTVVEVSTDKIDAEVPAPAEGVVTKILAQPDDTVAGRPDPRPDRPQRHPVAATAPPPTRSRARDRGGRRRTSAKATRGVDEDQGDDAGLATKSRLPRPSRRVGRRPSPAGNVAGGEASGVVISMPEMGESVTEGTVLEWHVAEGDRSTRATP